MKIRKQGEQKIYTKTIFIVLASILFYLIVCIGIAKLCKCSYEFSYEIFGNVVMEQSPGTNQTFRVSSRETIYDVSKRLREQGIIVNQNSFYARAKLTMNRKEKFRPGVYQLNTDMTYEEIINALTSNDYKGRVS